MRIRIPLFDVKAENSDFKPPAVRLPQLVVVCRVPDAMTSRRDMPVVIVAAGY